MSDGNATDSHGQYRPFWGECRNLTLPKGPNYTKYSWRENLAQNRKNVLMKRAHRFAVLCGVALAAVMIGSPAKGQSPPTGTPATPAKAPAPRKLAPGVVESAPRTAKRRKRPARHDVVEQVTINDKFNWAKDVHVPQQRLGVGIQVQAHADDVVDVPQPDGKMQRKLIWYMVYSVTNPGKTMHPVQQPDGTYKAEFVDQPIRFVPVFNLEVHHRLDENSPEDVHFKKVYTDRLIPVALGPIGTREDRNRRFFNTTEVSDGKIAVGKTVWGIVTWEDVDPRTKWFSVYVKGLTNAYRWIDTPGEFTKKDFGQPEILTGRRLERKILKLNFWRPSDEYFENEREIRYGVPGRVDYEWIYR